MEPKPIATKHGTGTLRRVGLADLDELIALNKLCFPTQAEEPIVWNRLQLQNHLRLFPEGQILVEIDGRIAGAVSSLVVDMGTHPHRPHTYAGITDGGFFHNHDPRADTLYGADVYVHPGLRGGGVAHALYEARRALCRSLGLRRILAGGRLDGYAAHASRLTPEEYVAAVVAGELHDAVLGFQLREGFVVRGVLRNYILDPASCDCASLIEWLDPDWTPRGLPDDSGRPGPTSGSHSRLAPGGEAETMPRTQRGTSTV